MRGEVKTRDELIGELAEMRQRIAELEKAEAECKWVQEALIHPRSIGQSEMP